MAKGKIVLVPFPFDDFSKTKVRPVLCLTNPVGLHKHIIVAFISSKFHIEKLETDILITPDHGGFSLTGLQTSSKIQLHRLTTIPSSLIKRELGILPPSFAKELKEKLGGLFNA